MLLAGIISVLIGVLVGLAVRHACEGFPLELRPQGCLFSSSANTMAVAMIYRSPRRAGARVSFSSTLVVLREEIFVQAFELDRRFSRTPTLVLNHEVSKFFTIDQNDALT